MSRSDYPPGYEESHGPPYTPQDGPYQPPPAYGFPSYGGVQPGQPSAPYPAGPNAPLYGGQPAGYPSGPYPGQPYAGQPYPGQPYPGGPHPGGPQGGGYPNPPPMPPIIPPVMPSDVMSSDDEFAASGSDWDSLSIRHTFIRKVYTILAIQLLVTTAIVAVFIFVHPVKHFIQKNQALTWTACGVYTAVYLVLICCKGPRRKFPWNYILLTIFTLSLSYLTGAISCTYETEAVFLALGITAVVCIAVTVFCFQTKVDFTKCRGLVCVLGIVIFITGIITTFVLSFKYIPWLDMLYAGLGAIAFTFFLAYNTQLLIGNRKYSISPEEYVYGALTLYVDIIQIFLFLLRLIGAANK